MKLGYALTGSFCTVSRSLVILQKLATKNEITPIVSPSILTTDTRFGKAEDTLRHLGEICGKEPISTVKDAEPLGPKLPLDALIVCPCTGNTLAKLACGITDTSVTMAVKAHLRCDRPLVLAISTNDALSQNLKNLATMLQRKSVFVVPFSQDDPINKPHSLISDFALVEATLESALNGIQLQPLLR